MIVILRPDADRGEPDYVELMKYLSDLSGIRINTHEEIGAEQKLTELYLIGDTHKIDQDAIESFRIVERVVRISREYRILGRHKDDSRASHFDYNGVRFGQDNLQVFAGLCAVDTPAKAEEHRETLKQED